MKRLWQTLKAQAARFMVALEKNQAFRFLQRLLRKWGEDDAGDRAGAIAFYAFVSIFPLLLGVISILGFFLPDQDIRNAVSEAIVQILPGSVEFIEQTLESVIELRGSNGILSIVGLIWTGSNLFAALRRASNRAWGLKYERNFIIGKIRDLAMVLGTGLLLLLSMALTNAINLVDEANFGPFYPLLAFGSLLIGFLLTLAVFAILNRYQPNKPVSWRFTWPGALLSTVLFQAGTYIFVFYLSNFADYQSIYGPLGSVIVLLIWIYASAVILLLGVAINSVSYEQSTTHKK